MAHRTIASSMHNWALAAGIALMVVWGVNFAVTKVVLAELGVWPFLFIRFLAMTLFGFALLLAVTRRHFAKTWPARADLPRFAAAGLVGHTAHVSLVMWGIDLSTAFSSSLVLTTSPLWTLLILALLGAEKLHRRQLAGTLAAFAGIAIFLSDKFVGGFALAGVGDLVLLFAASLFSLYTVISKPLVERYGPLNVMCYSLLFGAPPLVLATLPAFINAPLDGIGAGVWFGVFWAIAISSFLGWIAWAWVNSVRGLARSAPLQYLMPPIAGLVAWLTLGETFTGLKILGAIVALAGIAWAQLGAKSATPPDAA
jgi:drug/metabolite transporter (DMT)-like permease